MLFGKYVYHGFVYVYHDLADQQQMHMHTIVEIYHIICVSCVRTYIYSVNG